MTDHSLLFNIVARCCKEYGKQLFLFARKSWYIDLCVGGLTNGLFLATSSRASMKILGDLSLPYLVFDYESTDGVNVIMQLINVTVLDNCKSANISGVNCDICGGKSAHSVLNAILAFVGEMF